MKNYFLNIFKFFRSADFSKAVILSISISVPILVFVSLDLMPVGVALAMGCLLASPSDIQGSFRHKVIGVSLAALLAGLASMATGYASVTIFVLVPILALLMFGISYFAVFGFRASLVAFSGLFAIVLSFANISSVLEIWERALLVSLGGFWYLGLSVLLHFINPKRPTEELLSETMELTARYLQIRAKLLSEKSRRKTLKKELFQLQGDLNDKHETLRDTLIRSRVSFGNSNYARKRLLIFIELVDILELAVANPVDYRQVDELFAENSEDLKRIKSLIESLAAQLEEIAAALEKSTNYTKEEIQDYLQKIESGFTSFKEDFEFNPEFKQNFLLQNLFDYLDKQAQKINTIVRVLYNLEKGERIFPKRGEVLKFITPQDYDPKMLLENFNFNSVIFRHSLRLAIVVLIGFSIGAIFSLDNAYWILLTIVVIMRPNYGLTKERSRQRIIGTLIGAVIAIGIIFFIKNEVVYGILGLLSLTLAFSLIQKNYRTAAVFITLSIIFIYALLQPNVYNVIQFRVIDTIVGAGLAAFGNYVLWPAWEVKNIKNIVFESLKANIAYLKEIDQFYHKKGKLPISYKLARKQAFLETGNLNTAFQRMTQEPKSQQKDLERTYKIVSLNQTFLGALASLGTFIRNHETTSASVNFEILVAHIISNLENTEKLLQNSKHLMPPDKEKTRQAGEALDKTLDMLLKTEKKDFQNETVQLKLREAHLIRSQLKWLLEISEKIHKNIEKAVFN